MFRGNGTYGRVTSISNGNCVRTDICVWTERKKDGRARRREEKSKNRIKINKMNNIAQTLEWLFNRKQHKITTFGAKNANKQTSRIRKLDCTHKVRQARESEKKYTKTKQIQNHKIKCKKQTRSENRRKKVHAGTIEQKCEQQKCRMSTSDERRKKAADLYTRM